MTVARKRLVWIIAALGAVLIGGMLILKIWFAASVFMPLDDTAVAQTAPDEPLDAEEQQVRDMVTPVSPGTPVMPVADAALDPDDYSRELAAPVPIAMGMDRYAAVDALLLYYNAEPESGAKVSSSERTVDGATLFVIRRSGLADDALSAEETFALFDDGALVDFGSRVQCRRGDTPDTWTTELCP
ncbi:hypothetical protein [uncultured Algimonas sp.]|uniref:hypothetical protein n=1 Tax=uncultured Algimonas sp. TaxID=1547920 RepID=UPI00261631EE|nr:hypothetical protein [uncultured Algimonas sp.]